MLAVDDVVIGIFLRSGSSIFRGMYAVRCSITNQVTLLPVRTRPPGEVSPFIRRLVALVLLGTFGLL